MTKERAAKREEIQWPPLKQPSTGNLMDAIIRDMTDDELDAVIRRNEERKNYE